MKKFIIVLIFLTKSVIGQEFEFEDKTIDIGKFRFGYEKKIYDREMEIVEYKYYFFARFDPLWGILGLVLLIIIIILFRKNLYINKSSTNGGQK
ncbi:MAG: hypothetical protein NE327_08495 [Lentisphaeraceae bacterium]|nr:hypothetical protein [Lentisphaeraceae bacterium]